MRATEIIRGILDIIDQVEEPGQEEGTEIAISLGGIHPPQAEMMPLSHDAESMNRYKQIVDLLPTDGEMSPLSNSPNEKYADVDAVTKQSGDDLHKSKNPADIRSNATSMFPGYQHDPRK